MQAIGVDPGLSLQVVKLLSYCPSLSSSEGSGSSVVLKDRGLAGVAALGLFTVTTEVKVRVIIRNLYGGH